MISLRDVAARVTRLEQEAKMQAELIESLIKQLEDLKAKPNGEKRTYRKRNPSQD